MKVLLFDPGEGSHSFNTFGKSYWTSVPHYGLCALSSCAKIAGHSVSLLDTRQISGYEELRHKILEENPDVVGLTMRTCDEIFLAEISAMIKKLNPEIIIIVGGVHVGIAWVRLQENKSYDYLVTGEGEGTFPKLLNYLDSRQERNNLQFLSHKVIQGEYMDMDSLPFIDRELYPYEECIKHPNYPGILKAPMITMVSSRGCPYSCKYCAPSNRSTDDALFGRKLKYAGVSRVIDELKYLRDKYHFKSIKFYDYTFTINRTWVEEFCQKYQDNGFDQEFAIQTRADLIAKNPDIIQRLSKIGLKIAIVGYESGSDRVLESLDKKTTVEQNLKAAEILRQNNVMNVANIMLGTPFETNEDVDLTVKHVRKMKPDIISVSFYTPVEGTPFYDYAMEHKLSLVESANDLYSYAPDFKRIKGIDYAYLKKASRKILANNFHFPLFGYFALLLYAKTKRHVVLREFLASLYIKYMQLVNKNQGHVLRAAKKTYLLGIGGYSHDASCALLEDGKLIAAVQEERLTRIKHIGGFPYASIQYCLNAGKIKPQDIHAIVFYAKKSNWDSFLWDSLRASASNIGYTLTNLKGFVHSVGYRIYRSLNFRADFAKFFYQTGFKKKIFFAYDHHACHAASAFFSSPFKEALILCLDGGGDGKTTTAWMGRNNKLTEIDLGIKHPHSIGLIYTRITRYLGFLSLGDEYKVMGLAAYGKPVYIDKLRKMIIFKNCSYRLNMEYFIYQYEYSLSRKFYKEFGPPRKAGDEITQHYADMAASVQKLYEETLLYLAIGLKKKTGIKNLAVSGGSALNCTGNGKLLLSGEFDNIFVPPGASDIGSGIGAAQFYYHQVMKEPRDFIMRSDNWGPEYSTDEILQELNRASIKYEILDDPAKTAAKFIAQGKILGWFQGRMEFGPRALGYRSILADPRKEDIKDKVNKFIKFREEFRPFAPSCLREYSRDYFGRDIDSPFMTFTLDVLPEKRNKIPGVVHVDGTARLQTVSKEDNPLYYSLIAEFNKLTGIPIILNTSFNLAGEPIVCSPFDAIRTFYTSGIDVLIMEKFMITKNGNRSD